MSMEVKISIDLIRRTLGSRATLRSLGYEPSNFVIGLVSVVREVSENFASDKVFGESNCQLASNYSRAF